MAQPDKPQKGKRPSLFWLATEIGRAVTEMGISTPYRRYLHKQYEGDGHPVLVLPGFMASDMSTKPIRKFIDKMGYQSYAWDLGRNTAKLRNLYLMIDKIDEVANDHGQEVSLIGWSLGGVYARQIAKERPDLVRQVMTLGSPFRGIGQPNHATWIYNLISSGKRVVDLDPALLEDLPKPTPVPTTSIYTKQDGVVPWEMCVEEYETDIHQNVQVRGSHLGLGVNASVFRIVADRLTHSKEDWRHFQAQSKVEDMLFYPSF